MTDEELIPIAQILDDMYSDKGMVSSAARDYYYVNYATKQEKKVMDLQNKIQYVVGLAFIGMALLGLVVELLA